MGEVTGAANRGGTITKSYFDVLGICCPSEVPLIEKILKPVDGVYKVSVIVPSRTVIVEHDPHLISQFQIVKALNQARLEATIRAYGTDKIINKWPSPYILACGMFLLVSLFQIFFRPLRWLAIAAVAIGLPPILLRSIAAIRRCTLDINILMLIAVSGAVALRDFSEAGFIVFLFTIAEWLETMASHKATAGMSALMSMAPQKAILAETGQVVDARDVKVNTILAVKAGEVIPIDGIVVEGKSEVNEQSLTGESFPVAKQAQSVVWAGTLNIDGYISVKTTALAENSAVAKMARLVEEAQNSRSQTQRLIDSCAKYYTPATVLIAGGVAIIPLILRVHNPKHWFQLALVLLVSACPCALVLSTPVATFCSLLKAARIGLLVKGGDVLEALARTRVVAFDKTGTITKGEFHVVDLCPIGCQVTVETLLYWISSIESKSSHPMASALVDHARLNSIEPKPENVSEFQIYPGEGVYGEIDGRKIYIGNKKIATRAGCDSVPNPKSEGIKEAVTLGYVFSGTTLIGMLTLSDSCRTGAAEAIRELKSLRVKVAMLTGDSTAAAMHAQNQLGNTIEVLHAELLPEDKVRIVNELKTKEGPTTMVGDGMNDAPALAAANVGISMGISGSAVAMETSHITLMSNDILKIPKAIRLARKTHHKIIANIIFSVITKIAILALAIAGHPLLWAAVLADVGTCLIVILNSMLLLKSKPPKTSKKCHRSSHTSHVHKHKHADHCSKGLCSSAESDHKHIGSKHCSDGQHGDHRHGTAPEDQWSITECCQSQDQLHHFQETDRPAANTNRKHIEGCRTEHYCKDSHDRLKADCHSNHHGDDAHFQCGVGHHFDDTCVQHQQTHLDCCNETENNHSHHAHAACGAGHHSDATGQNLTTVSCCSGSATEHHQNTAHTETPNCTDSCKPDTSHQHVIFMEDGHGKHHHHGNDALKHCNSHKKKKEIGGCCNKSERKEFHTEEKGTAGCCKTEMNEYEKRASCCSSSVHGTIGRTEIECQSIERKECEERVCCSSSAQGIHWRREISSCCQSYMKECGTKDGCCGGGIAHLPEIVIE